VKHGIAPPYPPVFGHVPDPATLPGAMK